ncbi:MAG: 4Fe-4S binding protein [Pirellulaceae bacterium]
MQHLRRRILAIAIALLGIALLFARRAPDATIAGLVGQWSVLQIAIALVVLVIATLMFLTTFVQGRSTAWLRLDWFTPAIRRIRDHTSPSHSLIGRMLRRVSPGRWQSDHKTKRRGLYRKTLRWLGISWLASPVRRIVQAICLLTFMTLFLYVCWPYDARPLPPASVSAGWTLDTIDQENGEFVLRRDTANSSSDWAVLSGQEVVVFDALAKANSVAGSMIKPVGRMVAERESEQRIRLRTKKNSLSGVFAAFLNGSGTFDLYQHDPSQWPSHYADSLAEKEIIPAETFLIIDPLVSLSTAIASRSWVWSLVSAAAILIVCVLIPRGFCGYLCPLGTTIDLFDWAIAGRTKRFRVPGDGWWVHIKYYLLAGTLVAAVCGVLVSGFFSAIPVITRAMLFVIDPLQSGVSRGWHLVPAITLGQVISIAMFAAVLCLGFLRPRFWCKYVCPSGAVFSLGNLFRVTERKVESSCINCNKCVEICPFDAIKLDFTTRTSDCTMCQSCGGVCPTHAIKFVERFNVVELKVQNDPPTKETALGRRGFLSLAAGSTAAVVGGVTVAAATKAIGANLDDPNAPRLIRPPGSVPEQSFLDLCIRCGECFKACPNNVLQPEGFQQGLEGLWAPMVVADWAGCESSCNACGQVCPTGAIRPLPIEEKKVARMGLAIVNEQTCLPFAGMQECDLCVQECNAAGYHAIEFSQVGADLDDNGQPIDGTGYLAPVVLQDQCVGCGLCQTRCYAVNVKSETLLSQSAIIIEAGGDKEDRVMSGSYIEMRKKREEASVLREDLTPRNTVPPASVAPPDSSDDDPFGLGGF